MPKPAQRYDIYLPLRYNDGREVENEKFLQLQDELIERFGGVTSIKQTNPLQGIWRYQEQKYTDEIIIVTTLDFGYLGLIDTFPISILESPQQSAPRDYTVSLPDISIGEGKTIQTPIVINDMAGLTAGGISLKYDSN